MADKLRLLKVYMLLNLKTLLSYKGDFLLGLVVSGLQVGFDLVFLGVIFKHTRVVAGWQQNQMVFLYALVTINLALYQLLYGNIRNLKAYLFSGEMERLLWQPQPPLFALRFRDVSISPFSRLLLGLVLFFVTLPKSLSLKDLFYGMILSSTGVSILSSLMVMAISLLFYTRYLYTPYDSLTEFLKYTHYPLSIFPSWISWAFIFVFPLAYLGYLPAKALLFAEVNPLLVVYGLMVSFILHWLSKKVFYGSLSHYDGSNV